MNNDECIHGVKLYDYCRLCAATDEELEQELERRKQKQAREERPKIQTAINWLPLITCCEEYMNELEVTGYVDEDSEHYIYEAAIEAIYGPNVWNWINKQL